MIGCATSKKADVPAVSADGTIEACKVKKPPENQAKVLGRFNAILLLGIATGNISPMQTSNQAMLG